MDILECEFRLTFTSPLWIVHWKSKALQKRLGNQYIDLATAKSEAPIEKLSDFGVKQIFYRVDIALYVHPKRCTVKFKSNNGS